MVGTPANTVGLCILDNPKIPFGLNFGAMRRVAPIMSGALSATVRQNTWNMGRAVMTRSCSLIWRYVPTSHAFEYTFLCVSMAPFGFPVVPEV